MSKVKAFLTLLFSAIGVFAAREFYKPRNIKDLLKWRGVKLAADKRAWDSMFFENQKELEEMNIGNSDALWAWCNGKFKQKNLNDEIELSQTKKFCSDNPTTIMARIIREGEAEKVIAKEDQEAFSINYQLAENRKEVLELIGYKLKDTTVPKPRDVWETLAKWCEGQKRISVTSQEDKDKIGVFKTRCYERGVKNVVDLLKKQGKTPLSSSTKYEERFNKGNFKYATHLMQEIKKTLENDPDKKERLTKLLNTTSRQIMEEVREEEIVDKILEKYGWMIYKSWCEKHLTSSLLENEMYPQTYKKVSFRCTEEEA